ncbi:hypothetical protein AAZX31_08G009100 [Glycine max]|uniref:BHLH domain-containing protein n=1 Tax=Glycine max TaxID=3847 RepID=I1KP38_SOYBN|nr:transcription factor bHLH137 [Glycine max]XP_028247174.1 transcription factor bHLH137-like [Glycine soja]KAG5024209.1 hypothetical protein JHK86_020123 [Glycine max]KAH1049001.1 hypothetical protein GYH30_019863 [Glycine max]KRH41084.1 hypothetical protein GLYMA_08G009100v4 [Glycine max]|eukprot:XP_003532431.2 transcription factor bHLH137 [Glycine max]
MAAFSSQYYHPFLVDSACLSITPPIINTSSTLPPSPHYLLNNNNIHIQETSYSVTNNQETSCVDNQSSKVTTISDTEYSVVNKNHSPETSMVVDKLEKGEQFTQKVVTPMEKEKKRRARNGSSKESTEGGNEKQKKPKEVKKDEKKGAEDPPTGYIHVRARRGQATDSHSLAERVRREKISERMKTLQRLVPGCDKVTGKALVLDEIINYVQSLQNQVEFLSMKLALVNPMFYDLAIDLDTLMVRPDQKLNYNIASPSPCLAQFRPNQAIAFADTTTTNSFPTANNGDYLLDYSSSLFLQGPRSNLFFEYNGGQFWDVEDQRQKFLHPYGFGNNSGSFN